MAVVAPVVALASPAVPELGTTLAETKESSVGGTPGFVSPMAGEKEDEKVGGADDDSDDDDSDGDEPDGDEGVSDEGEGAGDGDTGFQDDLDDDDDLDEFDDIDEDDFDDNFDDDFEEEVEDDYEIEIDDEISAEFGLDSGTKAEVVEDGLEDFDDFESVE